MRQKVNIFWFRRDLRLDDNAALYHALRDGLPVVPVFIFDKHILDQLEDKCDRRVNFIHQNIHQLHTQLISLGSSLYLYHGWPASVFQQLLQQYEVKHVFANHDYEAYSVQRDDEIKHLLSNHGAHMTTYKDHVIFEKHEVVKADGRPYTVFTPFSKAWRQKLVPGHLLPFATEDNFHHFIQTSPRQIPAMEALGFYHVDAVFPSKDFPQGTIEQYDQTRDYPAKDGTTGLGVHLRFGTISIRKLVSYALATNATFLSELIWREFYQFILFHFPHINKGLAFKPAYEAIEWRNNEQDFLRWCNGTTGYPLVDAGMRQLNATGLMHNRVRMVTASFLTKHLLIDWRWGEAYFAQKLLDYEFASNNGGWQWASGSGCDAAPYFRIFNPTLQAKRFDPKAEYIKKWVPEYGTPAYPLPMVDHELARKRALEVYNKALKSPG